MSTITLSKTTGTRVQKEDEKKTDAPESVFKTTTAHKLNTDPNKNCNALDTKSKCNANPTICRWDVDSKKCLQIVTMEQLAQNIQTNVEDLSSKDSAKKIADLLTEANIIPRITDAELDEARSRLRQRFLDVVVTSQQLKEGRSKLKPAVINLLAAQEISSDAAISFDAAISYDHVTPPVDWLDTSLYGDNMEIELNNLTGYDQYIVAIGGFMEQLPSISGRLFSTIRTGLNNIWQKAGTNILSMLLEFFTNIMNNITELTEYLPSTEAVLNRFLASMKNIIRVLNKIFVLIRRGASAASTALGHLINACVSYIGEAVDYLIDISPAVLLHIQTVGGDIAENLSILFSNLLKGFQYLSYHIFNNVLVPIGRSIGRSIGSILVNLPRIIDDVISELVKLLNKVPVKKDTKRPYSRIRSRSRSRSPDARKANFKEDSKKHTNVQSKKVVEDHIVEDHIYDLSDEVDNIKKEYRRQRVHTDAKIVQDSTDNKRANPGHNRGDIFRSMNANDKPSDTTQTGSRKDGNLGRNAKLGDKRYKGGNMTRRKMSRRKMSRRKMIRRKMSRRK